MIVHSVSSALLMRGISLQRAGNRLRSFDVSYKRSVFPTWPWAWRLASRTFAPKCSCETGWSTWDPKPEPILPGHKACFVAVMHSAVYNVCICYRTFLFVQSSGTIQLLGKFLSAYVVWQFPPVISSYQWFIVLMDLSLNDPAMFHCLVLFLSFLEAVK